MEILKKLSHNGHIHGLLKLKVEKAHHCDACKMVKQSRSSFKPKNMITTSRPLHLLQMYPFGPTKLKVLEEKGMHLCFN